MSEPAAAAAADARRASGAVLERLVELAARLRLGGVRVGTGELEAAARAMAAVNSAVRRDVHLANSAMLQQLQRQGR